MLLIFIIPLIFCVKKEKRVKRDKSLVDDFRTCGYQTYMSWKTRVSSNIHQTPQIVDFFDDDQKEILIPTSIRYVEAIDGEDGEELDGWPWSHPHFTSTSSSLLYDINSDGEMEIIAPTFDGEIIFLSQHGEHLSEYTIKIPPLLVEKGWYEGLDEEDIEVSMNLRRQTLAVDEEEEEEEEEETQNPEDEIPSSEETESSVEEEEEEGTEPSEEETEEIPALEETTEEPAEEAAENLIPEPRKEDKPRSPRDENERRRNRREESVLERIEREKTRREVRKEKEPSPPTEEKGIASKEASKDNDALPATSPLRRTRRRKEKSYTQSSSLSDANRRVTTQDGFLSEAAKASMNLIYDPNVDDAAFEFVEDNILHPADYHGKIALLKEQAMKNKKILVDAHILSTPVIADLFGDGKKQLIVSVSYFFDSEYYSYAKHTREIPVDVDIKKYVAGGIVVIDLETRNIRWSIHLDLTTKKHENSALVYSSPTLIDFDSNGSLDILLSNSMGHLYAISREGKVMPGFPLLMRETQGMVLAEDLTGDGNIEVCTMDISTNYVCYKSDGKTLWTHSLHDHFPEHDDENQKHRSRYTGVVGDVNGDGKLNVVLSFSNGYIFALDGETGEILADFPFRVDGEIHAPISLIDFHDQEDTFEGDGSKTIVEKVEEQFYKSREEFVEERERMKEQKMTEETKADELGGKKKKKSSKASEAEKQVHGLDIVFPSYNGKVYIINPRRMCADIIDIGEESMSRVLVDDLTNDGMMELLVSSINGDVSCIGTRLRYHPLKTIIGEVRYENGFTHRLHHLGVYVPKSSREYRDIVGSTFTLSFVIHDKRTLPEMFARKYKIRITVGERIVLFEDTYDTPGRKTVTLPVPSQRMKGTVYVEMVNEHGQLYVDSFTISFNMRFLRVLKWTLLIPFFMAFFFIYGIGELKEVKEMAKDFSSVLPN